MEFEEEATSAKTLNADTRKRRYIDVGSEAEAELMAEVRKQILEMDIDLLRRAEENKEYFVSVGRDRDTGQLLMNNNQMYMQRMVMMCTMPLSRGLSPQSLVQSVGMYVGMAMISPDFRRQFAQNISAPLRQGIDGYMANVESGKLHPGWSDERRAKHLERLGKFRDRCAQVENGGRMPFTPESAALERLKIDNAYYRQLRDPKIRLNGSEALDEAYVNNLSQLNAMCEMDGISAEELNQAHRTLVGMIMDNDPTIKDIYSDLAFDRIKKAPPRQIFDVRIDEFGRQVPYVDHEVWTGEFVNVSDGSAVSEDVFNAVRHPFNEQSFAEVCAQTQVPLVEVTDEMFPYPDDYMYMDEDERIAVDARIAGDMAGVIEELDQQWDIINTVCTYAEYSDYGQDPDFDGGAFFDTVAAMHKWNPQAQESVMSFMSLLGSAYRDGVGGPFDKGDTPPAQVMRNVASAARAQWLEENPRLAEIWRAQQFEKHSYQEEWKAQHQAYGAVADVDYGQVAEDRFSTVLARARAEQQERGTLGMEM